MRGLLVKCSFFKLIFMSKFLCVNTYRHDFFLMKIEFLNVIFELHNEYRAKHGVANLTLDDKVSKYIFQSFYD